MIRTWTLAAVAATLMLPSAATTQGTPRRPVARPRVRVDGGPGTNVFAFSSRGRIGVIVDTRADANSDKVGARIEGITPGGPAEKAGLKAGDVITRFRGTALGGAEAENDEDSGPGMKLIDLARALDPGDTVEVEYRRGTDTRKATLIAEDLGASTWTGTMEMPEMRGYLEDMLPKMRMGGGEGGNFEIFMGSPWGGIELVKLNPDLGDYFGTRDGVLVVKAPEDSSLALKGGDVIVSIGGRKPSSPEQAMRILRSYDVGESVTLDVLRKRSHVNVTWKVPDRERSFFRTGPRMREEPSRFRVMPKIPAIRLRNVLGTSRAI